MTLWGALLAFHAVCAVLGVGQLGALALTGAEALFRPVRVALALMLLSGAALDYVAGGAWHEFMWFRASVGLLVVTGVLLFFAKRRPRARRPLVWSCCGIVAIITALMELKPV